MCGMLIIYYKVVKKPSLIAPFWKICFRKDSLFISSFLIISICVDEDAFFDYEKGIYVAGKDFDAWRLASPNATPYRGTQANYTRRGIETERAVNF